MHFPSPLAERHVHTHARTHTRSVAHSTLSFDRAAQLLQSNAIIEQSSPLAVMVARCCVRESIVRKSGGGDRRSGLGNDIEEEQDRSWFVGAQVGAQADPNWQRASIFYRSFAFDPHLGIDMAFLGICRA